MVSSITPGATGATALGVEPRFQRSSTGLAPQRSAVPQSADRVELGEAAAWAQARESVREGIAQLRLAISIGQEAQVAIARAQELSGSEDADAAAEELETLLERLSERIDAAAADGARLIAGEDLSVQAEPNAPPVAVAGLDLRLKNTPGPDDIIRISRDAQLDATFAQAARASLDALHAGLSRLSEAARALEAHQGFLGAAEGATSAGVRDDLDADAARLLALQVRQGLDAVGAAAIANVEPQAVLTLFRT